MSINEDIINKNKRILHSAGLINKKMYDNYHANKTSMRGLARDTAYDLHQRLDFFLTMACTGKFRTALLAYHDVELTKFDRKILRNLHREKQQLIKSTLYNRIFDIIENKNCNNHGENLVQLVPLMLEMLNER